MHTSLAYLHHTHSLSSVFPSPLGTLSTRTAFVCSLRAGREGAVGLRRGGSVSFVLHQHPKDCNEHRPLDLVRVKSEDTRTLVGKDHRGSRRLLENTSGSPILCSALTVY